MGTRRIRVPPKSRSFGLPREGAMPLPVGSVWLIERERDGGSALADQKIEVIAEDDETFTAKYINIDNPSHFKGELWAREMQVINIRQHDQNSGYVAFHTALPKKGAGNNPDYYGGRWYDVAGNHGAFKLSKIS